MLLIFFSACSTKFWQRLLLSVVVECLVQQSLINWNNIQVFPPKSLQSKMQQWGREEEQGNEVREKDNKTTELRMKEEKNFKKWMWSKSIYASIKLKLHSIKIATLYTSIDVLEWGSYSNTPSMESNADIPSLFKCIWISAWFLITDHEPASDMYGFP